MSLGATKMAWNLGVRVGAVALLTLGLVSCASQFDTDELEFTPGGGSSGGICSESDLPGFGAPCTPADGCPNPQFVCLQGNCAIPCGGDEQCPQGECLLPEDNEGMEIPVCINLMDLEEGDSCMGDNDCAGDEACAGGICRAFCANDGDCDDGEECADFEIEP